LQRAARAENFRPGHAQHGIHMPGILGGGNDDKVRAVGLYFFDLMDFNITSLAESLAPNYFFVPSGGTTTR